MLARADEEPTYDNKKASEWVAILQQDASARKRALAVVALGDICGKHSYPDGLKNGIGRSLRKDTSAAVRTQCAQTIAGFKPELAREIDADIVTALTDEQEPRVRKELAITLGRFPAIAKKGVDPLTGVLKDADPASRVAAADALAKVGTEAKGAAPELLKLLDDPDKAARQMAIFALGRIGPENPSFVAAALVNGFSREKEAELRREALLSIKLIGDKSGPVIAGLVAALSDADVETRAVAVRTLGAFGTGSKPAADALLKYATTAKDVGARVDAVRAFGSALGPDLKGRVKDLIGVMEADPDFEVRLAAVEEIGALGNAVKDDKEVLAALRKRQSDPQVKVREGAAAAIRRIEKKPEKTPEKKP